MENMEGILDKRNRAITIALGILVFGSIWGLFEATLVSRQPNN